MNQDIIFFYKAPSGIYLGAIPTTNHVLIKENKHYDTFRLKTVYEKIESQMIAIPLGSFKDDEGNIVKITEPFYIGKYQVTQAQWQAVMGNNNSSHFKGGDLPVEKVSWHDCQEFIAKLSETRRDCMDTVKIYYDEIGQTLTVWFGDPQSEYLVEETESEVLLMKNEAGQVIGFERLHFTPTNTESLQVELIRL